MNQQIRRYGLIASAVVVSLVVIFFLFQIIGFFYFSLISGDKPIEYVLSQGNSSSKVAYDLQQKGLLNHPRLFIVIARLKGEAHRLQAGGYRLYPGETANDILNKIAGGKVAFEYITVIEGWTTAQLLNALNNNPYIEHHLQGKSLAEIAKILKINYSNPEGWFYPDTYQFTWGTSDVVILKKAHELMELRLKQTWETRAPNLRYANPYQALIVASLIVREAKLPNERPIIAGIILNRLKKGMMLQIDPTVIYGMGQQYQGKITLAALRAKNPYNTYTRYGLPPTPIALPDESSIYAALHPVHSDYLYFVAKGDGSHVFSKTLQEQDAAIRKYILHQS